jgi:hypothetical protein
MTPALLPMDEAARELFGDAISRDGARGRLRRLINAGAIQTVKVGRRVWIPAASVEAWRAWPTTSTK